MNKKVEPDMTEVRKYRKTPDGKVRVPSVTDAVYEALADGIQKGLYGPGQLRLRALAEQLGVSPVPVREALRRLEAEGLVVFGPNRRISVNALSEAESREIFAIRINLETLALRHALPGLRSSPQRLVRLKKLIEKMDDYENKPDEWQLTNQAFHRELYAAAEMPRLVGMISTLWQLHQPYLRLFVNSVKSFRESQEEHRQILEHVIADEPEAAIALLEQHLLTTAEIVRNRILARETGSSGAHL